MEFSTAPSQGLADDPVQSRWSPAARPTVNTAVAGLGPSSTAAERSPLPTSSLSLSSHSSPWTQSLSLASPDPSASFMYPQAASRPAASPDPTSAQSSIPTSNNNDWGNIFSAPLNPAVFAQLAASGVLGPPPSVGGPSSMPSTAHAPNYRPAHPRELNHNRSPQSHSTSSSYATPDPAGFHKLSGQPFATAGAGPSSKGKSHSISVANFTPIHPRGSGSTAYAHAERKPRSHDVSTTHSRQTSSGSGAAPHHAFSPDTPLDYNFDFNFTSERSNAGLPPSLWMSPTSTSPSTPGIEPYAFQSLAISRNTSIAESSATSPLSGQAPPASSKRGRRGDARLDGSSSLLSEMFSDELFPGQHAADQCAKAGIFDPKRLQKEDPLATQVWKMYARTKANLPHAQRMENLTWRMMALALKKKKDEEAEGAKAAVKTEGEEGEGDKEDSEGDTRGRRVDKGKTVSVVGFDGKNQDGTEEDDEIVPMDWRAMSRSRSRAPMDWRAASRSRSRPPPTAPPFEHPFADSNRLLFPSLDSPSASASAISDMLPHRRHQDGHFAVPTYALSSTPSIPISHPSQSGRHSPSMNQFSLAAVYENTAHQHNPSDHVAIGPPSSSRYPYVDDSHSSFHPSAHPSSLPSHGIHGMSRTPTTNAPPPDKPSFPKHVRKTSFDHTVSKDGILAGIIGRHQVNGKPLPPESLIGTKRRADAPHAESMLRADPPSVHASPIAPHQDLTQRFPSRAGPSYSQQFNNFNFLDPYFDFNGAAASLPNDFSVLSTSEETARPGYADQTSLHGANNYSPTGSSPHAQSERLSAGALAASAAVAENYAHLSAASLGGVDDSGLEYQHLMNLVLSNMDNTALSHHPYTHVDPTQILPADHNGDGTFASLHPSPSSDGFNGFNSSNAASPEPHNRSSASNAS
ncbi:hypothetical protein EWM64_g6568, partial [Hericium alpestre]